MGRERGHCGVLAAGRRAVSVRAQNAVGASSSAGDARRQNGSRQLGSLEMVCHRRPRARSVPVFHRPAIVATGHALLASANLCVDPAPRNIYHDANTAVKVLEVHGLRQAHGSVRPRRASRCGRWEGPQRPPRRRTGFRSQDPAVKTGGGGSTERPEEWGRIGLYPRIRKPRGEQRISQGHCSGRRELGCSASWLRLSGAGES